MNFNTTTPEKIETEKIEIKLRRTEIEDLHKFFQFQLDKEASHLAAFVPKDSTNKSAYLFKHTKMLNDPTVNYMTILVNNIIVGSIVKFEMEGEINVTYWIDRDCWGQGIVTKALKDFLDIETTRPILGRVAFDNFGSQKVLEKCGFVKIAKKNCFANARQTETDEFIYKLTNI
ncbi:Protein N-acetyltransferase, RimJ/RimL family [Fodinibius roseus]|uniref:Protein N-acetyltransferase, RimJ/RimL family n=1 Tax=Fodinibius roseus TaxID=1194090 RepID=A0A1M5JVZ3_9BACT|nr:GNAT family N-acetyltransferase [Fodinibius roseus]SHG44716.1 Protein N-acetyltransferase, RimJ/RimL family [Fodinibius roseus]